MKNITVCAPAKINLFLDVTAKRPDGYHNIVSVMHPVTLSDTVSITQENGENAIRITCDKKIFPYLKIILHTRPQNFFIRPAASKTIGHIFTFRKAFL